MRTWTARRRGNARVIFEAAACLTILVLGSAPRATAGIPFPTTPDWQSTPSGYVSTGCALRDLDGDGYPDLIVANGNDMARQPVVVYRNQGGTFPLNPTWVSGDVDYNGHLDLADVDGDGKLDLAVAVYLGASGFSTPGHVKIYRGNGDGTFSSLPVWVSADSFYCFSVAFGDLNMDGLPDLACTAGESYNRFQEHLRAYRNAGGALETTPYWQSADTRYALDVTWGDVNGDGLLDVAYACESNPTSQDPTTYPSEVYLGTGTNLAITPAWRSQDGHDYSNTVSFGDLNGDGWLDLAVADNNQLHAGADYGRIKVFLNDGHGHLGGLPAWTSAWSGYGSNVSWADVDADGDLDLIAGQWWGPVMIFQNQGGTLPSNATWQSSTGSVVENIVWDDINEDGQAGPATQHFAGNGSRKLFVLARRPARVTGVWIDGVQLPPSHYLVNPEQGWLVLSAAPASGSAVTVTYGYSISLDFAVSNWDDTIGNYVFYNRLDPTGAPAPAGASPFALRVSPNPVRSDCRILLPGSPAGESRLEIFDAAGSLVRACRLPAGASSFAWNGADDRGAPVAAGCYWVRLDRNGTAGSARVTVVR